MNYFDSDMPKSTNTVVYFDWKTAIYIYVCGQCRTQFAKFEQTIIHQQVHLRRESQSHELPFTSKYHPTHKKKDNEMSMGVLSFMYLCGSKF